MPSHTRRRSQFPTTRDPRRRGGFTLIELLVALVLLDLALLGVAASSAVAARQLAAARTRGRAAAALQSRLEWAVAQPCGDAQQGQRTLSGGLRESWSLSAPEREIRNVTDTVEWNAAGSRWRQVMVGRAPC